MRQRALLCLAALAAAPPARATEPPPPLVLESRIALPDVRGRIDHLAVDLGRKRLFVAELGNGTVDVVDLARGQRSARLADLGEPQGVAYVPGADRILVTSGTARALRVFRAGDLSPAQEIPLGEDGDNLHVEPGGGRVVVGYASGRLAAFDAQTLEKQLDIELPAHPEGFAIDGATARVYVNVPDAEAIVAVDLAAGRQVASWSVPALRANYPLALVGGGSFVAAAFRKPAQLVLLGAASGAVTSSLPSCGDADDVFFDARRSRIYLSCGEGVVDVFEVDAAGARRLARVPTAPGARTSLLVPELDRLFVAARAANAGSGAAILVFRPTP